MTSLPLADDSVVHRSCTLCEALCGLDVTVTDGHITAVTGDPLDPLSRGHLCPKGVANIDLQHDPDRLTRPLVRVDGELVETDWDTALDRVADGLRRIRREHGRDAIATYLGNPAAHNPAAVFLQPLVRLLGSRNRYAASSTDQAPQSLAAFLMFGHQLLFPLPDFDRTDHLLVIGANPAVSNGSLVTAPDVAGRIRALRARGGRCIVVDPRRTETARIAGEHVAVRPGTDAVLLAAMANLLFEEGRVDLGRIAAFADGLDAVRGAVAGVSVEDAARVTGVPADTIAAMARDLADAPRAAVYARVGICQSQYGSVTAWLVNLLNVLTGNLDEVGGVMFATPAVDLMRLVAIAVGRGSHDRYRSRVRDLPEVNGELPVATLADEITTPGEGQVRGLVVWAGNPVLSAPNGARLDAALPELDLLVAVDFYLNETNRHADVVLPPTGPFEHEHVDFVFHALAVRNTIRLSPAVVEPAPDSRHDHEIVLELAARMIGPRWLAPALRPLRRLGRVLTPTTVAALAVLVGPWGVLRRGPRGLTWGRVRRSTHGIDLGPLQPGRMPGLLYTRGKRIALAPQVLVDELATLRATLVDDGPAATDGELTLIGRRHLRSNNSWLHNSERMVKGRDRCTLLVHPTDAERRGIGDGEVVRVTSRTGTLEVAVEVDDDMRPGVVSLPHGWGHDRDGTRWQVAEANAGVSVNDITDHELLDTLTGNAAFNDVQVTVERRARPAAPAC